MSEHDDFDGGLTEVAAYFRQCGEGGRPAFILRARDRLLELERENAELRGVVSRLPVTADGVPVVPGMALYYPPKNYSHCVVDAVHSNGTLDMHGVDWDGTTTNVWRQSLPLGYSTKAAAEAAKSQGQKGGE